MPDAAPDAPETFSYAEALRRERRAIWGDGAPGREAALCLSGGGIRSAAFCLGVLQALAADGVLKRFHYLSTVSGGGYIGCWLQGWLLAHARQAGRHAITPRDLAEVEALLGDEVAAQPLQRLRGFTSFLTPRAGLTSPDTWAGIVLWLRNVLINWAIFMPALFAVALLPRCYLYLITAVADRLSTLLLVVGLLPAGCAAFFACSRLPSHATGAPPDFSTVAAITGYSAIPALLWAALTPLAVAPFLLSAQARAAPALAWGAGWGPAHLVPLATLAMLLVAYGLAWLRTAVAGRATLLYWQNLLPWLAGCATACGLLGLSIRLAAMLSPGPATAVVLAVLGPTVIMLSHLCLSATFVALRREVVRGELDREWLARLSAIKLVPVLLWAALAAASLLFVHTALHTHWSAAWLSVSAVGTAVSGAAGALLGRSSKTIGAGDEGIISVENLAALLTIVFAAGLLGLLASAGDALLADRVAADRPGLAGLVGLVVAAACLLVSWLLGGQINVNRFSLHGVYRNRLARAFLGSVRQAEGAGARAPDPFTDFDPSDNFRMQELAPEDGQPRRLFPVIGTAMNLVNRAPTAWQERMAAPFTISPVACGSNSLPEDSAFSPTALYAGSERETGEPDEPMGMTVGTAMALSGAAVSPSQGYHSSPWTAFLMTLFNVRLGAWLPNPAIERGRRLRSGQPPNALRALADEMLGRIGSEGPAIYLSDGGHFDNLGLYEMVRRRCALIVVIDAGQDPDYTFEDLSGALRKIRIDMNADVTFSMPIKIGPEAGWTGEHRPFALADITWREPPATGRLLYIKPCRLPDMPVDVRSYAAGDHSFPNDSTFDQFFTESRFESYRKLGRCIGAQVTGDGALASFLRELVAM